MTIYNITDSLTDIEYISYKSKNEAQKAIKEYNLQGYYVKPDKVEANPVDFGSLVDIVLCCLIPAVLAVVMFN